MPHRPRGPRKGNDRSDLNESALDLEDEDEEEIDPNVKDIFEEAQELGFGRGDLVRKLGTYTDKTPELTGGDLDASWEYADVGEEAVGGQNPTPDQSVVDEEGEALGITYNDNEPLRTTDKLEERDENPWELNPASSLDYSERVRHEFNAPLKTLATDEKSSAPTKRAGAKTRGRPTRKKSTQAQATQHARAGERQPARQAGSAKSAGKTRGVEHSDVSRSTRNDRVTNVARGVRGAPSHVRSKAKGKRTTGRPR